MPIPGVGFPEVVIILIAALMIFGPAKLPEVMGQAGKALRDFRKMTGNLQGEFERNLNEVAGTDVRKTLSNEISGLRDEVQGAANAVSGKPAAKTTTARPATTASKPVTPATSKATTTAAARKTTTTAAATTGSAATAGSTASTSAAQSDTAGEIEYVPVRTTSRRGSSATIARPAATPSAPPATPVTATRPRPAAASRGADVESADPFARARSRRDAAGYQR